nr:MAG TPA: hypothetical protein [Caudoviricetes sp.]
MLVSICIMIAESLFLKQKLVLIIVRIVNLIIQQDYHLQVKCSLQTKFLMTEHWGELPKFTIL